VNKTSIGLLAGVLVSTAAFAGDFPTSDRVEYVLECMFRHGGAQVLLYKCSCAIDNIAKEFSYDDYIEASTIARSQGYGQQGAMFRDDDGSRKTASRYRKVQQEAERVCGVAK